MVFWASEISELALIQVTPFQIPPRTVITPAPRTTGNFLTKNAPMPAAITRRPAMRICTP